MLRLFHADPEQFDVVLCANATTVVKLIPEGCTTQNGGFKYQFRVHSHTSPVRVWELPRESACFSPGAGVEM